MKELGKLNLKEMEQDMPVIQNKELSELYGGSSYTDKYGCEWFDSKTVEKMIASGTWEGGWIPGVGYVAPSADSGTMDGLNLDNEMKVGSIEEALRGAGFSTIYGSGIYGQGAKYTLDEANEAIVNGTWNGGFVEDMGYLTGNEFGDPPNTYTQAQADSLMKAGKWEGGYVQEYGYIEDDIDDPGSDYFHRHVLSSNDGYYDIDNMSDQNVLDVLSQALITSTEHFDYRDLSVDQLFNVSLNGGWTGLSKDGWGEFSGYKAHWTIQKSDTANSEWNTITQYDTSPMTNGMIYMYKNSHGDPLVTIRVYTK